MNLLKFRKSRSGVRPSILPSVERPDMDIGPKTGMGLKVDIGPKFDMGIKVDIGPKINIGPKIYIGLIRAYCLKLT